MKKYFENLNGITYTINNNVYQIKDIFDIHKSCKRIKKYQDKTDYYYSHEIREGEKWEDIAKFYYGNKNLEAFWILVILNDIIDVYYDFPLTNNEMGLSTEYVSRTNIISQELFEKILDLNDDKRIIKILKPEYINNFTKDFFKGD